MSERITNLNQLSKRDQAYYILTWFNGSWIVDALGRRLKDSRFCDKVIREFVHAYSSDEPKLMDFINECRR